jgi:hypothetical protein
MLKGIIHESLANERQISFHNFLLPRVIYTNQNKRESRQLPWYRIRNHYILKLIMLYLSPPHLYILFSWTVSMELNPILWPRVTLKSSMQREL